MELADGLGFARSTTKSVLVTIRRDARPQLSNVLHGADDDGVLRVSITADRAKYHNLVREPWAALHVTSEDFWSYVVLEGPAEVSEVAAAPDDATVEELVQLYRTVNGEHSDWDDFRAAMVRDRRVVARVRAQRCYGQIRSRKNRAVAASAG